MTHSLHNAAPREALTDTIMAAKIRHNLTFDALAEGTGLSLAFVTAALLGQHALPEPAARTVAASWGWTKRRCCCCKPSAARQHSRRRADRSDHLSLL